MDTIAGFEPAAAASAPHFVPPRPEPARKRVLLVDAPGAQRDALARSLEAYGFDVRMAGSGPAAEQALAKAAVDLIVLEPQLPGEDGLDTCRRLVARALAPMIILSAAGDPIDRIVGLEMGADDYLPKPAEARELVARIRAVLRRVRASGESGAAAGDQLFSGWRVSVPRHEVAAPDDSRVTLSRTEFALLRAFLAHPQTLLDRNRLLELTGQPVHGPSLRGVDTQVSRLRQRLEACARGGGALIRTVNGRGYMLDSPVRTV